MKLLVRSETFLYGAVDAGLFVTVIRGRPDEDEVRRMTAAWDGERALPPHASLVDLSGLAGVDPAAFAVLIDYLNSTRAAMGRALTRQAVVRPPGLAGAIIDGFRTVVDFTYPARVCSGRDRALAWLGRTDAAETVEAWTRGWGPDEAVVALRGWLRVSTAVTLPVAARRLGVSERSLQRRLRAAGTSFVEEVAAARLAAAKRLLIETDRKLGAIAHAVGCATQPTFSTMFRRLTGETPSAFRARHRVGVQRKTDGAPENAASTTSAA